MSLGSEYWIRRMQPFVNRGFSSGSFDDYRVVLTQDLTGVSVSLHRPGSDLLTELEELEWGRYNGATRLDSEVLAHLMSAPFAPESGGDSDSDHRAGMDDAEAPG